MTAKIINIILAISVFLIVNDLCKVCSAYFPRSRCKKNIYVKSNILADLLISKSISRDKFVNPSDFNKMSIVGLISYICIIPCNILGLITGIMKEIYIGDLPTLDNVYYISMFAVYILYVVFLIIMLINTDKCKNR